MRKPERLEEVCGWILPDGTWFAVEQWWHISAIYDLQKEGFSFLQGEDISQALKKGEESKIRALLATLGFVKVSGNLIDAEEISAPQLVTLQGLFEFCNPDDDLEFIQQSDFTSKYIKIGKVMKLKSPRLLNETGDTDK